MTVHRGVVTSFSSLSYRGHAVYLRDASAAHLIAAIEAAALARAWNTFRDLIQRSRRRCGRIRFDRAMFGLANVAPWMIEKTQFPRTGSIVDLHLDENMQLTRLQIVER